jgi:hypothetical protein
MFNLKLENMKQKGFSLFAGIIFCSLILTSCNSYTSVVGEGAKGNQEVTKWNHYLIFGLAPIEVSDAKTMAGGSENYSVTTRHSFVNGLLAGITFGIYTPTTTTVKK